MNGRLNRKLQTAPSRERQSDRVTVMAMTMRERIAQALWGKYGLPGPFEDTPSESIKAEFMEAADAVLAELQTPTDGMVDAMIGDFVEARGYLKSVFSDKYSAAIRAAREGR